MTNTIINNKHPRYTVVVAIAVALLFFCGTNRVMAQTNLNELTILDLATARNIALQQQPTLQQARYRAEVALARVSQARSGYWPTLSISAGVNRYDPATGGTVDYSHQIPAGTQQSTAATGGYAPYSPGAETWYQAGARATWLLFSGFQRSATVAAANFGYAETEAARHEAERQILYAVTAAYLNAQSARAQMQIAEKDAEFNQRLLDDAISRRKAGNGSLGDELNFRVRANAARSTVIFAKRQLRLARIGLAALMGLPDARLPEKLRLAPLNTPAPQAMTLPNLTAAETQMQEARPDLQMARAALSRRDKELTVAKSGFYPKVALTASYDGHRNDDFSFESDDFSTSAGVVLSYDIFSGGLDRAKAREACAAISQEQARYNNTMINARQELLNAYEQLKSAVEYLKLQNENLGYATQNRDLIEKSYNVGQEPIVRLNEAQKDLIAAQVRQTQAVIALLRARNDFDAAIGTILQQP